MFVSTQAIVWPFPKTQKGLLDLTVIYPTMMTLQDIIDMDRELAKHVGGFTHHLAGSHLTIVSSTGIFLASFQRPAMAFTFEVLDHFRLDALECKTAAMNFMSKIARISNEAFPDDVPCVFQYFAISIPTHNNI